MRKSQHVRLERFLEGRDQASGCSTLSLFTITMTMSKIARFEVLE